MKYLIILLAFLVACSPDPIIDPDPSQENESGLNLSFSFCKEDNLDCYNPLDFFEVTEHEFVYDEEFEYEENDLNDSLIQTWVNYSEELVNVSFLNEDPITTLNDEAVNIQIRYKSDDVTDLRGIYLQLAAGESMPIDFFIRVKYDQKTVWGSVDDLMVNQFNIYDNSIFFEPATFIKSINKGLNENPLFPNTHVMHVYKGKIKFNLILNDAFLPQDDKYVIAVKGERDFLFYFREEI